MKRCPNMNDSDFTTLLLGTDLPTITNIALFMGYRFPINYLCECTYVRDRLIVKYFHCIRFNQLANSHTLLSD